MNVRDSVGVFTDRHGLFEYTFEHEDVTVERVRVHLNPEPVLKMIRYVVRIHAKSAHASIIDATRLPWCREFHALCLPPTEPYQPNFTRAYFDDCLATIPDLPTDFIAWALHDQRYHFKRLVPNTPASKFKTLIGNPKLGMSGYERLVREFAVDATVLHRLLPSSGPRAHPLVEEAVVFAEFTARMIRFRKVWLSERQLDGLLVECDWWKERCRSMADAGLLVTRPGGVALGWAVAKLAEFAGARVTVAPFVPPTQLGHGSYMVDPRYPVDAFVHRRELACSMVEGVPALPFDSPAKVMRFADACTFVREEIGSGKRTICFSESGELDFDRLPLVTVLYSPQREMVSAPVVVQVGGWTPTANSTHIRDGAGVTGVISNASLYQRVQVISHEKFSNLYRYPKDLDVDYVIAFFGKSADPGMYLEIERFKARKIMIKV